MAPRQNQIWNPDTRRWVSRTGRIGRKVAAATKLGDLPPNLLQHIATLGGSNVAVRLAGANRSSRATLGPNVSARVASARDAFLRQLRMARRAFAKSVAPIMAPHYAKLQRTRHEVVPRGGRVGKSNFIRDLGNHASHAYFKVAGQPFKISVYRPFTFEDEPPLYEVRIRYMTRGQGHGEWGEKLIVTMSHKLCGPRWDTFDAKVDWGAPYNLRTDIDPIVLAGIRKAVDIFQYEMRPALEYC